ncbi:MAG: hypothetical protein ACYDAP_00330 [Thermoplasmataceae archaeon]
MAVAYITKKKCLFYNGRWIRGKTYPSGQTEHGYCQLPDERMMQLKLDGVERSPHYHRYLNDDARRERERKSAKLYETYNRSPLRHKMSFKEYKKYKGLK